jgi:hypothetical protein
MTKQKAKQVSKIIVQDIIYDLKDRKGLQNEWDSIDKDIQQEIIATWEGIILHHITKQS